MAATRSHLVREGRLGISQIRHDRKMLTLAGWGMAAGIRPDIVVRLPVRAIQPDSSEPGEAPAKALDQITA